ncbi:anti-sigma factor [Ornithinimicrobium sp. Arc0846-15]|nr:anti-sigma factor [Ornithinimicrobium laminariae]
MHIKGDELAELAIGGTDLDAAGHVADCAECAAEVEALADIARGLAELAPLRLPPPPHVWTAIHAEVTGAETTVVDLDQAREERTRRTGVVRRLLPLAVAAAVGALAMWTGLALAASPEDTPTMANSESQLAPLLAGMDPIICSVTVEEDHVILDLNASELPELDDKYLEVWLMNSEGELDAAYRTP